MVESRIITFTEVLHLGILQVHIINTKHKPTNEL